MKRLHLQKQFFYIKALIVLLMSITNIAALGQTTTVRRLDGSSLSVSQIDSTVRYLMSAAKVEGLELAVINNNRVAYQKAYGFKDKEKNIPLDTNTVMYGASFSKAVFAYINMRLVEKGLIDLDKPLVYYLKKPLSEYGNYEELEKDERWKKITPRMCLSHTTGLPNVWWMNVKTGMRDTTLVNRLYFEPGSRYAYSGEGFKLLQRIEEVYLGKDLEKIAREELFVPAKMDRTSYLWQAGFEANSAIGYDENGNAGGKVRSRKAVGAGSMLTTISDYSRFISYVLRGKGLSAKTFKEMLRPQIRIRSLYEFPTMLDETTHRDDKIKLSYGLGWGVINTPYGTAFFKGGHDDCWRNYSISFPDKRTGIVIMCNSGNGERIFKELLEKLIGDTFTPWEWNRFTPYNKSKK
ncbi:serine hydrolase domain-containing protein [Chryseobacterium lathyri]|uniref:CubicO group peptidase (Beta-lactamase class C family) n=1 Tax=Chryseobacterium lathyri TaxID=395933 RepID=A0ABT9SMV9_9FLAO|nr:serine hydrolase domain-containing protein [Chryseobacterium lathyri]MDP9960755.1 CubicO group peptidase (beta-lactamase class C family) [Chryseobacterium lathyri]